MAEECINDGSKLLVPGFGLPINFQTKAASYLRHGINDFKAERYTAKEVAMLQFMDVVMDKKDWQTKVLDDSIVKKWKMESSSQEKSLMSDAAFEWCITE
jgi:hypothetical protein